MSQSKATSMMERNKNQKKIVSSTAKHAGKADD